MDFELGVQIEVEAVEEGVAHNHHHHDSSQPDQPRLEINHLRALNSRTVRTETLMALRQSWARVSN